MKLSKRLLAERAYVERHLADRIICASCGARLCDYADKCNAELSALCAGFAAIEEARQEFQQLPESK